MSALTLYVDAHYESPWALSAFVALEEKGLEYRLETISLEDRQHHLPTYRAPTRKVPALEHGTYWLCESSAIGEYLAETFPFPGHPRLFPEDLRARGVCRMIQGWLRTDFPLLRQERPSSKVFSRPGGPPLSA